MFSNAQIKAAIAAVVLAGFDLLATLGFNASEAVKAQVTTGLVLVACYFAPRISYLGHKYAGAIGAALGGLLAGLNLLTVSVWEPAKGVVATLSALFVAIGAMFVPSLERSPES